MAERYGDTPFIKRGTQEDYKKIFHTDPSLALTKTVTLIAGCGIIKAGTAIAKITGDGDSKNKYVPYNPTTITNAATAADQPGRAFLVVDAAASTSQYVTMADSYKFQVGDQVYIADSDTYGASAEDLGVITAIDRTTHKHMAIISVTNTPSGATFTVANYACLFHEAGADNTNTWSDCVGILGTTVETGTGENAKGGIGDLIISNCMLYNGLLTNVDAAARTDIGASVDGQFLILK